MAEKLKIIPLGGLNEIGKNLTVYEYGNDIIIVDVGMGFPDDDMYGVDVVIPDVSYLIKHQDKIRGIFITHGHEDHIGALPYVLRSFQAPIYATRMTLGLVGLKLEEHKLLDSTKLVTCEAGDIVKAGKFSVEFIHANHSIADAVSFAIKCPVGTVIHTGDFKIDPTPIKGKIMDLTRLGELGKEGVLALLCDSTNVERPGYTRSERAVGNSFDALFRGCKERIIVTTFASNVDRIQQIINVAASYGRKVAITGRSMENSLQVATELGYTEIPNGVLVDLNHIKSLPKDKVCIITTGSQGEAMSALFRIAFSTHRQVEIQPGDRVIISASAVPGNENSVNHIKSLPKDKVCIITTGSQGEAMSALFRIAFSTHRQVEIQPGDRVIISASAVPGNENSVNNIINELYRKKAEVVSENAGTLHVSGHACQEELKIIHALVRPKFFMPVHGEQRHLRTHARVAEEMGTPPQNIIIADVGRVVEFTHNSAQLAGTVPSGRVFVDGYGVGDVGSVVLRDRRHLAQDGMIVVVVSLSGETGDLVSGPDIITRGFVYVKESEGLMDELREVALDSLEACQAQGMLDWASIKSAIKSEMSRYLYRKTKRNPMILPVIMEV